MLPKKINILQVVDEENNMKIKNNLKTIKLNNMNKCFNFLGALVSKKNPEISMSWFLFLFCEQVWADHICKFHAFKGVVASLG